MNNIAVVIRGHARTWNFCKGVLLDKLSKMARNVDFYFSTWNTNTAKIVEIENDFEGYNLKEVLVNSKNCAYYHSYQSVAWLSICVANSTTFKENKSKYDAVVDTRPDIVPSFFHQENIFVPEPKSIYAEFSNNNRMSDLFFLFNVDVFERFSRRYIDIHEYLPRFRYDIHESLYQWCLDNGIRPDEKLLEFWWSQIVRPDILNHCISAEVIGGWNDRRHHLTLSAHWSKLPLDDKRTYCRLHNIDPLDYDIQDDKC